MDIKETLIEFYLAYKNDFVSHHTMASYYGMNENDLLSLIQCGRNFYEESFELNKDK